MGHGSQLQYGQVPTLLGGLCIVLVISVLGAALSYPVGW
jgi:hypothetical protein